MKFKSCGLIKNNNGINRITFYANLKAAYGELDLVAFYRALERYLVSERRNLVDSCSTGMFESLFLHTNWMRWSVMQTVVFDLLLGKSLRNLIFMQYFGRFHLFCSKVTPQQREDL